MAKTKKKPSNKILPYRVTIQQNVIRTPYKATPFKTLRAAQRYITTQTQKDTFVDVVLEIVDKKTGKYGLLIKEDNGD